MAEVLDQNEVDALLAAVNSGDVVEGDTDAVPKVFSHYRTSAGELQIRPYDFKRPERVSKEQMRALENLHDGFARSVGVLLSGFLRTIVEVHVVSIEQMTFSEFTHSLPNPTSFSILAPQPLEGNMCLEISPLIIYPVLDRLLGGSSADLFIPQRPLTAIEQRLVDKIVQRATVALTEAWTSIIPLEITIEESESNPQLVQIVPPNEVVVVVGFEIKMSGRVGTMSLCIPYNVIEPVIEKLSNESWAGYKRSSRDAQLRRHVARRLDSAGLTVSAILADTTMKLSELMSLQRGDIILTSKPANMPLTLMIGGKRKYIGHLGQFKGNRAFKVKRPLAPKDRV